LYDGNGAVGVYKNDRYAGSKAAPSLTHSLMDYWTFWTLWTMARCVEIFSLVGHD